MCQPARLEGALKIKEASYVHAEGFAGGELKHGVIALIEKGIPCIVIVANDRARESVLSNAMELKSRGGYIIGIGPVKESVFNLISASLLSEFFFSTANSFFCILSLIWFVSANNSLNLE